jgi:hypothetical protein
LLGVLIGDDRQGIDANPLLLLLPLLLPLLSLTVPSIDRTLFLVVVVVVFFLLMLVLVLALKSF